MTACPNRHSGTSSFKPTDSTAFDNDDDDESFSSLEIILLAATGFFFLTTIFMGILFYRARSDSDSSGTRDSLIEASHANP